VLKLSVIPLNYGQNIKIVYKFWFYCLKVPKFYDNILLEKKFIDIDTKVSIEIRIQTKEDFITTEAYYYTIHKNDEIKLNIKIPLLCMCFKILRRMSYIVFEEDEYIKSKYKSEIDKIKKSKTRQETSIFNIEATIYCLKKSHKGIIIGKEGSMLKKIGTYARQDLEKMLEEQVNLKIWVKVKEDWINDDHFIKSFKNSD